MAERTHANVVFIGDEVSAAGYRLAGAVVVSPEAEQAERAFDDARQNAAMVVLSAEAASHIPTAKLAEAEAKASPLIAVVPDVRGRHTPADIEDQVRDTLGLER